MFNVTDSLGEETGIGLSSGNPILPIQTELSYAFIVDPNGYLFTESYPAAVALERDTHNGSIEVYFDTFANAMTSGAPALRCTVPNAENAPITCGSSIDSGDAWYLLDGQLMRINSQTARTLYSQRSSSTFQAVTLNTYYDYFCSGYNNPAYGILSAGASNFTILVSGLASPAYLVAIGDLIFTTPSAAQATRWDAPGATLQPTGQSKTVGQCQDCAASEPTLLGLGNGNGNTFAEFLVEEAIGSNTMGAPILNGLYFSWTSGTSLWIDGATGALAGGDPSKRIDGFDSGLIQLYPLLPALN